jgi:hypothetical protein
LFGLRTPGLGGRHMTVSLIRRPPILEDGARCGINAVRISAKSFVKFKDIGCVRAVKLLPQIHNDYVSRF